MTYQFSDLTPKGVLREDTLGILFFGGDALEFLSG